MPPRHPGISATAEKKCCLKNRSGSNRYSIAEKEAASVNSVTMTAERACLVTVDADQLSLAIGKEGQNARLAARLTGYKIDIKAE